MECGCLCSHRGWYHTGELGVTTGTGMGRIGIGMALLVLMQEGMRCERVRDWICRCRFPHADSEPNMSHAISCVAAPRCARFTSEKCISGRRSQLGIPGNAYCTWSSVRGRETAMIRRDIPRGSNGCAGRIGCVSPTRVCHGGETRWVCRVPFAWRGEGLFALLFVADREPELDGTAGGWWCNGFGGRGLWDGGWKQ